MRDRQPTRTRNLDRYGGAPLPWSRAQSLLRAGPHGPDAGYYTRVVGLSTAEPTATLWDFDQV
jgi:hypothetical protein